MQECKRLREADCSDQGVAEKEADGTEGMSSRQPDAHFPKVLGDSHPDLAKADPEPMMRLGKDSR